MNAPERRAPRVAVITLNWNGRNDTIEWAASLGKLDYPNYSLVVIDNGSSDGSVAALREQYPDMTVIENGRNLGYAEGFNVGLKYAYEQGADYILIMNNDTVAAPDCLTALVQVAETDPRIGFVSGKVYYYQEPNRLQTAGRTNHPILLVQDLVGRNEIDTGQYDEVKEYDFLDDVFLLVRRQVYADTGGYDPNFFLYYEETDWCARVRRAGYKLVYTPQARIWHKGGMSTGGDKGPKFVYYNARNQIIFMRRNTSSSHFARYLGYLATFGPRRMLGWVKRRRFNLLSAYVRGLGSGVLWLIKDGRQGSIHISSPGTGKS